MVPGRCVVRCVVPESSWRTACSLHGRPDRCRQPAFPSTAGLRSSRNGAHENSGTYPGDQVYRLAIRIRSAVTLLQEVTVGDLRCPSWSPPSRSRGVCLSFLGGFPGVSLERRWTCPAIAVEGGSGWRGRQPGRRCRGEDVVVGTGRMEIGAEEVWNLSSGTNAGHGFPLAAGRRPCQRGGGRFWSGRGIEWQGWREGPQGKHLRQLACAVAQALGAGAEGVDEGAVLGAEL